MNEVRPSVLPCPIGERATLENGILPAGPVAKIAAFFSTQSVAKLKQDEREEKWIGDWLDYQAKEKVYARLLAPRQYSSQGASFSFYELSRAQEMFGYFSPSHGYNLQVSYLGIFPFFMSFNEPLKTEAVKRLEAGAVFAFGLSEKEHGSDVYSGETFISKREEGYIASGAKYYIGNANCAELISVLARKPGAIPLRPGKPDTNQFAFFALRPKSSPAYLLKDQILTSGIRRAYVGSFEVKDHELPSSDVICEGPLAWDTIFGTVNLGKFILGFGSVGICEHAFREAVQHMQRRVLYGKPILQMSHLKSTLVGSYARLCAMRMFAFRALDYLIAASSTDRRYLLFCAIQKARVSTQGVEVIRGLTECINAKAFEADTYFEGAIRDISLFPGLEGSTHINYGIAAQFMKQYFFEGAKLPAPPSALKTPEPKENPYLFGATSGQLHQVRFAHYLDGYKGLKHIKNVRIFIRQVKRFRRFLFIVSLLKAWNKKDKEVGMQIAKCFSVITYGQLVAENAVLFQVSASLVSVIFHGLIEDLAVSALQLSQLSQMGRVQRCLLRGLLASASTQNQDFETAFEDLKQTFCS